MLEAFMLGSFFFWPVIALVSLLLIMCAEYKRYLCGFWLLLGAAFFLKYAGAVNIFSYVYHNPLPTTGIVAGYFLAGTLWSLLKWYLRIQRANDLRKDLLSQFLAEQRVGSVAQLRANYKLDWVDFVRRYYGEDKHLTLCILECDDPLKLVNQSKGMIFTWIAYWPWSFVWTILDDPLRRLSRWIFRRIKGLYVAIVIRVMGEAVNDLPKQA